jgi:hypothetical protein
MIDMKPFNTEEYFNTMRVSHKDLVSEYLKDFAGSMTIFPETKTLPCYLYGFVAGPYQ